MIKVKEIKILQVYSNKYLLICHKLHFVVEFGFAKLL